MACELDPEFLDKEKVKMKDKNIAKPIQGSMIQIDALGMDIRTLAMLDPVGCRKCSITLVEGSVKDLTIHFGYIFTSYWHNY